MSCLQLERLEDRAVPAFIWDGGPQVERFDPATAAVAGSFLAFDPAFLGGVFVG